jgi:hypothetical protein
MHVYVCVCVCVWVWVCVCVCVCVCVYLYINICIYIYIVYTRRVREFFLYIFFLYIQGGLAMFVLLMFYTLCWPNPKFQETVAHFESEVLFVLLRV